MAFKAIPALLLTIVEAGCSPAPSQTILGSYFPSWMVCSVIGIVASVAVRELLVAAGVNEFVLVPLLTYAAIAAAVTMAVWLLRFG